MYRLHNRLVILGKRTKRMAGPEVIKSANMHNVYYNNIMQDTFHMNFKALQHMVVPDK